MNLEAKVWTINPNHAVDSDSRHCCFFVSKQGSGPVWVKLIYKSWFIPHRQDPDSSLFLNDWRVGGFRWCALRSVIILTFRYFHSYFWFSLAQTFIISHILRRIEPYDFIIIWLNCVVVWYHTQLMSQRRWTQNELGVCLVH